MQTSWIFPAQQMVKSKSVAAIFFGSQVKGNELAKIISHKKAAKRVNKWHLKFKCPRDEAA